MTRDKCGVVNLFKDMKHEINKELVSSEFLCTVKPPNSGHLK